MITFDQGRLDRPVMSCDADGCPYTLRASDLRRPLGADPSAWYPKGQTGWRAVEGHHYCASHVPGGS